MVWITLTKKVADKLVDIRIDGDKILSIEDVGPHRIIKMEGCSSEQDNYTLEALESSAEIVRKIKREWHYMYGPGRPLQRDFGGTTPVECELYEGPKKPIVRKPDWTEEHEQVRMEIINEEPELFPGGTVPAHLEVALNSHVTVYVRNRRSLRKAELGELLLRIKNGKT